MLRTGMDIAHKNGKTVRVTQKTLVLIDTVLDRYNDYLADGETE